MAGTFGVALGGGGMRGLAHIGVLKELKRSGFAVQAVAGTSMGGLIGAAFASGVAPETLVQELAGLRTVKGLLQWIDWQPGKRAMLSGRGFLTYFTSLMGEMRTFADLPIPYACTAVDIASGEEVVLRQGRLIDALNATMALPGIFDPVNLHGRLLIDGGIRNNVPADVARMLGADVVLAVDVSFAGLLGRRDDRLPAKRWTIMNDMMRSQTILMHAVTEYKLAEAHPDVVIRPELPEGVTALGGVARLEEIVLAGEKAAAAAVPRLRAALERASAPERERAVSE